MLVLFVCFAPRRANAQIEVEDDPKEDLYRISALDFLYVIGDEYPDAPDEADDITNLINKLIARSQDTSKPDSIDISEAGIHRDPEYNIFGVEMEGDIDDEDYVLIYAFIESEDSDRWISLTMELDDDDEEFKYEAYGDISVDNATGSFTDEIAWIAFNTTYYSYSEDDTVLILAMTGQTNFDDFLQSEIIFDFCPNSEIKEETGSYAGTDLITQFFDDVADFLFGGVFDGAIPFLLLIALLLVLAQVLFDRKNRYCHWIGFAGLLFLCFPIVMYAISINLVGVLGLPNLFSILEVFTLLFFLLFVTCSMLNNWRVFRRYLWAILASFVQIDVQQFIYMILYMTQIQIVALIILSIGTVLLYALLRFSRKRGRNAIT